MLPTEQRQATVLALLERGHADRMFLSQDWCSTLDWLTPEMAEQVKPVAAPNWSMTLPVRAGHPGAEGTRDDRRAARPEMVQNPKAWLG